MSETGGVRLLEPVPDGGAEARTEPGELEDRAAVTDPSKLVRVTTMTQAMLGAVDYPGLDVPARTRLAAIFNGSLGALSEVVGEELRDELDAVGLRPLPAGDQPPTAGELRVVQAQLVGWLQGLFEGLRAGMMTRHLAHREHLAELYAEALRPAEAGRDPAAGSYL